MEIEIKKMDHLGNGIGFIDEKIVFVPKTIPGDVVNIKIIKDTKTYANGKAIKYIKRSDNYIKEFCPFYEKCGGCNLQNMSYEDTLNYKKERVLNILNKINISVNPIIIENENDKYYRNKIELKIKDKKIGFYENSSHELIEIDKCHITKSCINNFINEIKNFGIINGDITVRCNYNDEILISIKTSDNVILNEKDYPFYKVVGIILNDKCIYGEDKFINVINNTFFEVSYDSFFQVNDYINSKLFEIISENVNGENVLDLYSGVGTLSIMASKKANKVYAIESIPNAVTNALKNAKMNNISNINFILGDASEKIMYINDKIDTIIVDPPRSGLTDKVINKILEFGPDKIMYISCETQKLSEDLKHLIDKYEVKKIYLLDMFSYTYHVETVMILERKKYIRKEE